MPDQSVLDAIAGLRQDLKDSNECTDDRYADLGTQFESVKENIAVIQAQYSNIRGRIAHVKTSQGAENSLSAEHSQGAVGWQDLGPSLATTAKDYMYIQGKYRAMKKKYETVKLPSELHISC